MWYPEFITLSCCGVKSNLTLQIFPIYKGDLISPPEGEAAQEVRPLNTRVKLTCQTTFLPRGLQTWAAERPSNAHGAAERPSKGGPAHSIEYFCEMISGEDRSIFIIKRFAMTIHDKFCNYPKNIFNITIYDHQVPS